MKKLPDFLVMGASRSGTSSLFKNLSQHPQIEGFDRKEARFFYDDKKYNRGVEWYKSILPETEDDQLCFEATPAYFHSPEKCAPRISKHLPDCKFITLLRNPVDRTISMYQRWRFSEELWKPYELMEKEDIIDHYLGTGIYVESFRAWFDYFPANRFLIIKAEDYFENEKKIIARCCHWLGVDLVDMGVPLFYDQKGGKQEWSPYQREMPDLVRRYLEDFFEPYNQKLYEFLERDFGW